MSPARGPAVEVVTMTTARKVRTTVDSSTWWPSDVSVSVAATSAERPSTQPTTCRRRGRPERRPAGQRERLVRGGRAAAAAGAGVSMTWTSIAARVAQDPVDHVAVQRAVASGSAGWRRAPAGWPARLRAKPARACPTSSPTISW